MASSGIEHFSRDGTSFAIQEGVEPGVRLGVNRIDCVAHGLCAELLPERIRLDEWGYPILSDPDLPPELVEAARRATNHCPMLALRLEPENV